MDQALEKEYSKPAKGQGGIIGISRRKEAVAQWNITKHEKAKFTKYLHELCSLNDEYTLHHEFSQSLIEADEECVVQIGNYIAERNNPFDTSSVTKLTNLVTGKEMDEETSSFLLACVKTGEDNYNRLRKARLTDKKEKLFDPITKVCKMLKNSATTKKADVKKETISAIRNIDYSRERNYSISDLLCYELTSTSFLLTQDGFFRKSPKSELASEIEKKLDTPPPPDVPRDSESCMIAIDFMAYARKVAVSKLMLKTFGDFVKHLWQTFSHLSRGCSRLDNL